MAEHDPDTAELIDRARRGDESAASLLFDRHRPRLRQMVALRMDDRLATRIDPSDVVQEALMIASQRLPQYADKPGIAFYPWLRQIAWNCLVDSHRRHVLAGRRAADREQQLEILESLLADRKLEEQSWLSGHPVEKGWISSHYGQRKDPFTGQRALHKGIDFAGKEGSDILAVAGGVVTYAGSRSGYGQLVEITHGDGFVTRYGHNKEIVVEPGDVVRKGESIALMGSSGRSTGAHVHFEVYKHGRLVDPATYIRRNRR